MGCKETSRTFKKPDLLTNTNNYMFRIFVAVILFSLSMENASAQGSSALQGELAVGKPCPDVFFQKTLFYDRSSFHLSELKGKWIVLDLWSKSCGGCIASLPHVNEIQKALGDSVRILMVTFDDSAHNNEKVFTAFHKNIPLQLPCIFSGTSDRSSDGIFRQFRVGAISFVVVVDPNGIVKAITHDFTKRQLSELMKGGSPLFSRATIDGVDRNEGLTKYDVGKPFLVNANGGSDDQFSYRSLISKWSPTMTRDYVLNFSPEGRFEVIGYRLEDLYRMAYLGGLFFRYVKFDPRNLVWPDPVLEVSDTSLFREDWVTGENFFCYSLIVPPFKADTAKMREIMRCDLRNYFGYEAVMETRKMPCWNLVIRDFSLAKRVITKGGERKRIHSIVPWVEYELGNMTMAEFREFLVFFTNLEKGPVPLVDETGILENIDIHLDGLKGNIDFINASLKKHGLEMVKGEREMQCVIIRNPKPGLAGGSVAN
jgi:thiol-disulfide isomerase/thioredoxin